MAVADRYQRSADLPRRVPIFPLRGAILLPRATLPLNVFEPRYLEMLDDVMSGGRLIGIIQPQGSGADESPKSLSAPLQRVGCIGRATSYHELNDGRLNITLTGIIRFDVIDETVALKPYRIMSVSYDRFAADLTPGLGEEQVDRPKLLAALKRYLEESSIKADWKVIGKASSEVLINALSVMSPYGLEEKQALLEAPDLKARADVLVALAEIELAARGGSGGTMQ